MSKSFLSAVVVGGLIVSSCTDPYKLQTNTFDEALVIEATITNEMKRQEIKISKTYRLEEDGPSLVTGADVAVTDDSGNSYGFSEQNGVYISDIPFQAVADRQYKLEISTNDGRSYTSSAETLTTASPITDLTAAVETVEGVRGVQIRVSSYDPTATSKYYRFRYDETYKVVAPYWVGVSAVVIQDNDPEYGSNDEIVLVPRTYEAQTCYSTKSSNRIILANSTMLLEDRIDNFPVRLISSSNDIIGYRYSINVYQYVQNLASYTFYDLLSTMSGSGENILSANQPGFFSGNIHSDDSQEKVIGFFEVSSVSQRRIFFNYDEMFPGELQPPFFMACDIATYDSLDFGPPSYEGVHLRSNLVENYQVYYSHIGNLYETVPIECGDCTSFSSNLVPSFWID